MSYSPQDSKVMEVLREILQSQPTQDCLYLFASLLACLFVSTSSPTFHLLDMNAPWFCFCDLHIVNLITKHQYILSLFMQGMPWTRLGNQCWAVIREWGHTPEDYHGGAYDPTVIMGQCLGLSWRCLQPKGYHGGACDPVFI